MKRLLSLALITTTLFLSLAAVTLATPQLFSFQFDAIPQRTPVERGDLITYTVLFKHATDAPTVLVYAAVPEGTTFVSVEGASPLTYSLNMRAPANGTGSLIPPEAVQSVYWQGVITETIRRFTFTVRVLGPGSSPSGGIRASVNLLQEQAGSAGVFAPLTALREDTPLRHTTFMPALFKPAEPQILTVTVAPLPGNYGFVTSIQSAAAEDYPRILAGEGLSIDRSPGRAAPSVQVGQSNYLGPRDFSEGTPTQSILRTGLSFDTTAAAGPVQSLRLAFTLNRLEVVPGLENYTLLIDRPARPYADLGLEYEEYMSDPPLEDWLGDPSQVVAVDLSGYTIGERVSVELPLAFLNAGGITDLRFRHGGEGRPLPPPEVTEEDGLDSVIVFETLSLTDLELSYIEE